MAPTRTAPLRAPDARSSLDEHPLGSLTTQQGTAAQTRQVAATDRRVPPTQLRGSLQALDWRQALGGALVVLGMVAIVVAWFGVSGTLDPGEQMPYISSGGFGGAALIAIGVTLLISFEHTRDRDALAQVLDELDDLRRRLDQGPATAGRADGARRQT